MGIAKFILIALIVISLTIVIYMIIDLNIKKSYLKKGKTNKIHNKKYIILIIIIMLLFIAFGITRNFV